MVSNPSHYPQACSPQRSTTSYLVVHHPAYLGLGVAMRYIKLYYLQVLLGYKL